MHQGMCKAFGLFRRTLYDRRTRIPGALCIDALHQHLNEQNTDIQLTREVKKMVNFLF